MNFFEDQEHARVQSRRLVILFLLTVVFTALATAIFVTAIFISETSSIENLFEPRGLIKIRFAFILTFSFIIVVSLLKIIFLGKGGAHIAKIAGATPLPENSTDEKLKVYRNVVEEMSIASGVPVPQIYVMEYENAINAFAAGHEVNDAVIAVSRGCLDQLTRDELQGVVAHEFSHIFNGDMKLNLRLLGLLAGLTLIFEMGRGIFRTLSSGRRRSKKSGAGGLGVGLMVIGGFGMLLGSLLKAAFSRQREYLADASAVQYTRNPYGIGGALKKIEMMGEIRFLGGRNVGEISHFFFDSPIKSSFFNFETHPKLGDRIKRIFPHLDHAEWKGQGSANSYVPEKNFESPKKSIENNLISSLDSASRVLVSFPAILQKARVSSTEGELIALSIFSFDLDDKNIVSKILGESDISVTVEKIFEQKWILKNLNTESMLALWEVLAGRLKSLTKIEKEKIIKVGLNLLKADKKVSTSEFLFFIYLKNALLPITWAGFGNKSYKYLKSEVMLVYSFLVIIGSKREADRNNAFKKIWFELYKEEKNCLTLSQLNYHLLEKSFDKMLTASPMSKKILYQTALKIVKFDNEITDKEKMYLKVFGQVLGIPVNLV